MPGTINREWSLARARGKARPERSGPDRPRSGGRQAGCRGPTSDAKRDRNGAARIGRGLEVARRGAGDPAVENGAPSTTRTCDLLVRSQTLYPTELWARGRDRTQASAADGNLNAITLTQTAADASYNPLVDAVQTHRADAPVSVRCVVLTISDTRTEASDASGQLIVQALTAAGHRVMGRRVLRDDPDQVADAVRAATTAADVIITTGGTGITSRDSTHEAIARLLDKRLDGFGELFRMLSYQEIGAAAMLSRACAGTIRRTAVFALPGSSKAVTLAMEKLILPEMGHVVGELRR